MISCGVGSKTLLILAPTMLLSSLITEFKVIPSKAMIVLRLLILIYFY
jgi:hypothetical protein